MTDHSLITILAAVTVPTAVCGVAIYAAWVWRRRLLRLWHDIEPMMKDATHLAAHHKALLAEVATLREQNRRLTVAQNAPAPTALETLTSLAHPGTGRASPWAGNGSVVDFQTSSDKAGSHE